MLLRASGEREGRDYDERSVTDPTIDPGVADGAALRALTDAAIRGEWLELADLRSRSARTLGAQQTVDALVVASAFNGITRVADATGIPLDENTLTTTTAMRERTGIQRFDYLEKSARYDSGI
jgi:alkylhydroperoxidase family enzyme